MRYLDNAATTFPKPPSVVTAVNNCLKFYSANPGRSGHLLSLRAAESLYKSRKKAAEFFGCKNVENVIFTLNCTTAINFVLKGILNPGDHVICSSFEHNAVVRPMNELVKKGVSYDIAHVFMGDPVATRNSFEALIKDNTKLIVCTHASNVSGAVMPIKEISELCKEYGILFMVDAAQSAGVLPIDVTNMGIDYLCVASHKGLYAPMGTGILIATAPIERTIIEGGTGTMSLLDLQPDMLPDRFESGTINLSGIVGVSSGINFVKSKGISNIYSAEIKLVSMLYDGLRRNNNVILYTDYPKAPDFVPVLSFNIRGQHSEDVARSLNDYGIAVRAGLHCAPLAHKTLGTINTGTVRVSPSVYTNVTDIEYFINCIKKVSK